MAVTADRAEPAGDTVRRAQAGDVAAFDQLVRTRLDRSFRFACAVLGNEADAADAVQDAYVTAWRELPRLRDPDRFDGWLGRIVLNSCRQTMRRRGRVRELSLDGLEPTDTGIHPPGQRSDPVLVAERDALARAIGRLTLDQRAILALHHLEERSVGEIAARLGIPSGTVKWRLHAARRALERALAIEDGSR